MTVRTPTAAELSLVASLLEGFPGWTEQRLAEALTQDGFHVRVAGVPAQSVLLARRVADEAELLIVAVLPKARRHGLARALMRDLIAWAPARLFLEVAEDNIAAQALYAAMSFTAVGRRPDYYGQGRDALILQRIPSAG